MKTLSTIEAALLPSLVATIFGCVAASAAETEPQALPPAAAGAAFALSPQKSRFDIGANAQVRTEGAYQRFIGDKGVFKVDLVTGATLAVPNAPTTVPGTPAPKPGLAAKATPAAVLPIAPEPLTTNPVEHNAVAKRYLLGAGIPASEVAGEHVTTTMAGGGPISAGVQPSKSRLLFYTTHLERKLGGVPVENSTAFAALDKDGKAITEGTYWPAIPIDVVREAQALKAKLASTSTRSAFQAAAQAASQGGRVEEAGEVRIVHTRFDYHGKFEAKAVVTNVARSSFGGKAQIIRLDADLAPVRLADDVDPSKAAVDSPKVK